MGHSVAQHLHKVSLFFFSFFFFSFFFASIAAMQLWKVIRA
jgi:hypothetical protein